MNTNEPPTDPHPTLLRRIFSRENLIALALCLILIALVFGLLYIRVQRRQEA